MSHKQNIGELSTDKITAEGLRLLSLDVFRSLNIFLMIFANWLSERSFTIHNIPDSFRHAKTFDTMTFPDVIWPAFAFILGVSIPLAYQKRISFVTSHLGIWGHITIRAISLMVIGITTCHAWLAIDSGIVRPLFISMNLWAVMLFVSFFMIWSEHKSTKTYGSVFSLGIKISGLILLIFLIIIYREGEELSWMKLRWWIIGALGWGYLVACIMYSLCRKNVAGLVGSLALLVLLCVGDLEGAFDKLKIINVFRQYVSLSKMLGIWGLMAVTGTIVGVLFTDDSPAKTPARRIFWILLFAGGLYFAGFCLRPLYGISKINYTPTWALYSMSICCAMFAILYWLVDVKKIRKWAAPIIPAGQNALLPYFITQILHPLFAILHIEWINGYFNAGVIGIIKIFFFSLAVFLFSAQLTKRGYLKLKL